MTPARRSCCWLLVAISSAMILTSCVQYDITVGNGDIIRARTKPKLNAQGYYVFKDMAGREKTISPGRVRQIQAVRRGSKPKNDFH